MTTRTILRSELGKIKGFELVYPDAPFFHEFVDQMRPFQRRRVLKALEEKGILGGLPVDGGILWCATERNTKAQIDRAGRDADKGGERMKLSFERSVPGRRGVRDSEDHRTASNNC